MFASTFARYVARRQIRAGRFMKSKMQELSGSAGFWFARRTLRAMQVCFISAAIYKAGYSKGVVSYASNPERMEIDLVQNLVSNGNEIAFLDSSSEEYQKVESISSRILKASIAHCKEQIEQSRQVINATQFAIDATKHNVINREEFMLYHLYMHDAELALSKWTDALARVEGTWRYCILDDKRNPNAFVSDMCPRRIFVNSGLFRIMKPSDDELALIIGHELSHVLLGHSGSALENGAVAQMLQLVFLSCVDPTGFASLFLEFFSFEALNLFEATYSRKNEFEADSLGSLLAEKANFNSVAGSRIFLKNDHSDGAYLIPWRDSHPDSSERHRRIAHPTSPMDHNLAPQLSKVLDLTDARPLAASSRTGSASSSSAAASAGTSNGDLSTLIMTTIFRK